MIVECVPNFSAGRDLRIVEAIAAAIASVQGVAVLDRTADPDHDRSVITYAGPPAAAQEAAVRAVEVAAARIDLTQQAGVHPRLGAADVIPFVPLTGATLADCVSLAHAAGQEIWRRLQVPVYFYEAAAMRPDRVNLADVRRGGFEAPQAGQPDLGGPALHPTAGAAIVGARKFLVAYNINLASDDLALAQRIARRLRASSGGFPAVKALGLALATRGIVQVSMNLTDYEVTGIDTVYAAVEAEAEILGSELVGLIPRAALPRRDVRWEHFDESFVLENRLASAGL
ncbi:MAG: glutamate formimidoyltransferase [Bryobacteraceae bacterium]|nr:glutamate formimidoyltransferase [Bryobacteraceae bacterium]